MAKKKETGISGMSDTEIEDMEKKIWYEKQNRLMKLKTAPAEIMKILSDNKTQDKGVVAVIRNSEVKGVYRGKEGERHGIYQDNGQMYFFRIEEVTYLKLV